MYGMGNILLNRKVLVTRPEQQAEQLCRLIEGEGGTALRFPVQSITPVPLHPQLNYILAHLSCYHMSIFVSVNAVLHALKLLHGDTSTLNAMKVFAVGRATVEALQNAGVVNVFSAGMTGGSETLLQLPQLQNTAVLGARIIIFRGTGGREHLYQELKARGAEPEYAEIYRRDTVYYETSVLDELWKVQKPEVIVVSSNEGLQALVDMQNPEHRVIMQKTDLVLLSQRAADLAQTLGFSKAPYLATDTSDAGLFDALRRWSTQYHRTDH